MKQFVHVCFILIATFSVFGQQTFPVNGIHDERPEVFAFTDATIHVDHKSVLEKATLLIEKGEIKSVGIEVKVPANAVVYNLNGQHIYPSFIDLYANYGMPEVKKEKKDGPQMLSDKKGAYGWNQAIKPETDAYTLFTVNEKSAEEYRKLGFGALLTHQHDGIARGSGALVTLSDNKEHTLILKDVASAHWSFDKGSSTQDYPGSLMGNIALIKQTYLDAEWYAAAKGTVEYNISLEALNKLHNIPHIIETRDLLTTLRADKIGDEMGVQYIIRGTGKEYQKIESVKATGASMIIPLDFPDAFDVEDPYDAMHVSLDEMKHWEMAPANLSFLESAGITFAITSAGLNDKNKFPELIRKSIEYGLTKEAALKALTLDPARMIKAEDRLGSIETGKVANFLIATGDIFEPNTKITENWIQGKRFIIHEIDRDYIDGSYHLTYYNRKSSLVIEGSPSDVKAKIHVDDSTSLDVTFVKKNNQVTLTFSPAKDSAGYIRLSGLIEDNRWSGMGQLPDGNWVDWEAVIASEAEKKEDEKKEERAKPEIGPVIYPFTAYGYVEFPKQEAVLLKNATVWTNEKEGILEQTDVLIKDGRIAQLAKSIPEGDAKVIDATGKHITSGIIDEHSHIAISRGVNEWTQASSAEVSIADVVNSEDINIYRQLAGGVTIAQLLHGSANPIGGQSAIIKFRWGYHPEKMKLENAPAFIKFALGENVKQSNWGEKNTVRYPQTRMGVEQIFDNYFTRAREYEAAFLEYNNLSKKEKQKAIPPGKDLEMESLLEVLNQKRFVTCHSYVQSEINMLMKMAEKHGFRINTFTHILEGYKLADKMKSHGASASTFSDWWAFKYEVIDAIPYNAAILHEVGVNTGINSDDAEMGRRLNQEAAKGVKYGGMPEEDAWKMVTLNPAKMLRIDDRVGSIKVGKDADVVIWSDNPLSVYAKAEKTFVDGICFYDMEQDLQIRKEILEERARLIEKMIEVKRGGGQTQKPEKKENKIYHCDDIEDYSNR